jgi:hypothetical protein
MTAISFVYQLYVVLHTAYSDELSCSAVLHSVSAMVPCIFINPSIFMHLA